MSRNQKCSLASAVLLLQSVGPASPSPQSSPVSPEMVEKLSKSVVLIRGTNDKGTILGSGFLLSSDGKIATNLHVILEMRAGGVQLESGEIYDTFSILAFDERKDLAILQIAGFDLPPIEFGNSNEVKAGEPVIAIGSPRGLQGTVTAGIVSSVRDHAAGFKVIQTDAAANPGNSGGPLFNGKGQVIGVVTSKLQASEGLNFAVPINYVRGLMASTGKPMNLGGLDAALKATPVDAFKETPSFPVRWKSMLSGARYKIRYQGDTFYAEAVLSEDEIRAGSFIGWELHKGATGYSGTLRQTQVCTYDPGLFEPYAYNRCPFKYDAEFSVVTDSRIEGRVSIPPQRSKLNCRKCTYDKPTSWQPFVWIPE